MVLSFIRFIDLTLIGFFLFLLFLSLVGKLSPKAVLFLIFLSVIAYFGVLRKYIVQKESKAMDTPISLVDPIVSEDTLVKEEDYLDNSSGVSRKKKVINNSNKIEKIIPKEYEVKEGFRTYRSEGKWKWDAAFVTAIEAELGWQKKRNGNYIISIDYQESFHNIDKERQRKKTFKGGEIEISINHKPCHCKELRLIPEGIDGKNISETKAKIQDSITYILLENKKIVLDRIGDCLVH